MVETERLIGVIPSNSTGLDETELLADLPTSMKTDIALFLNKEVVEKVPFFKDASENFINVLVRKLKPQVCAPGISRL